MKSPVCFRTLLALLLLAALGCRTQLYTSPVRPPPGLLFTHHSVPVTTDFGGTPAAPNKTGCAETFVILLDQWVPIDFAFGDASIEKAAQNGHISKVYYADSTYLQFLGIFGNYKVCVYGE